VEAVMNDHFWAYPSPTHSRLRLCMQRLAFCLSTCVPACRNGSLTRLSRPLFSRSRQCLSHLLKRKEAPLHAAYLLFNQPHRSWPYATNSLRQERATELASQRKLLRGLKDSSCWRKGKSISRPPHQLAQSRTQAQDNSFPQCNTPQSTVHTLTAAIIHVGARQSTRAELYFVATPKALTRVRKSLFDIPH